MPRKKKENEIVPAEAGAVSAGAGAAAAPAKKQVRKIAAKPKSGAARKAEPEVTHKHKKSAEEIPEAVTAAPETATPDIARLAYEIYLHRESRGEFGTPEGDWAYAEQISRRVAGA